MMPDFPRGTSPTSERSDFSEATSQNLDLSTWLTKQQAADAIGVSTKTIEQYAKDGKIQQAVWRPQNRGAAKAVYQPDDVARIAADRKPGLQPFVLPAGVTPPVNGTGHQVPAIYEKPDIDRHVAIDLSPLASFAAALQTLAEKSASSENSSQKCFLTIEQAAREVGLTVPCVRRLIKAQAIATVRDAEGVHIRRRDLEAL